MSDRAKNVLFIQDPVIAEESEDETPQKFGKLTLALAKHDPEGVLSVSFFNWEGYYDKVKYCKDSDAQNVFSNIAPKDSQVVWLADGKGFRIADDSTTDFSVYEKNTIELMKL